TRVEQHPELVVLVPPSLDADRKQQRVLPALVGERDLVGERRLARREHRNRWLAGLRWNRARLGRRRHGVDPFHEGLAGIEPEEVAGHRETGGHRLLSLAREVERECDERRDRPDDEARAEPAALACERRESERRDERE